MSKVYDSLMKSGNFTAAQNKTEKGDFVDSIGELVALCEKEGYIERFYVEQPNDKVDITLKDMQHYTKTLIENETNLSNLIETAVKQNLREDENDEYDDGEIFDDDIQGLAVEDYEAFSDFLNEEMNNNFNFLEDEEGDE